MGDAIVSRGGTPMAAPLLGSGEAELPAAGLNGEYVAAGHACRGEARAKQGQYCIEGAGLVEVADLDLPDAGHQFEIALAMRTVAGNHAQGGVDQLLAGFEQFLGVQVGAAERAAGFGANRHAELRTRRA